MMEFTLIGADKLKVLLSPEDMAEWAITYEHMDYTDEKTRRALIGLLEMGRTQAGFRPNGAKLFIEVFPTAESGCVLYFTAIRTAPGPAAGHRPQPVVFEIPDADTLIRAAVETQARYGHRILDSALYVYHGRYRLVLYPLDYSDNLSAYFVGEFAEKIGEGEILAAFTMEHGEELLSQAALEVLSEYFLEDGSGD